jgi:MoxR-like ATPase
LLDRLGVREGMSPPRLTRVVEAFEAQAALAQEAEDLDYDSSGRLKFAAELDERVHDAKGASMVARVHTHAVAVTARRMWVRGCGRSTN